MLAPVAQSADPDRFFKHARGQFRIDQGQRNQSRSNAVVSTTTWSGVGNGRNLTVYCYFANAATALTGPEEIFLPPHCRFQ